MNETVPQSLRRIAGRIRGLDPAAKNTGRYLRRLTGDAARLLSSHWPFDCEFPHPREPQRLTPGAAETVWGVTFETLALLLRSRFPGRFPEAGGPVWRTESQAAGVTVSIGEHDAEDLGQRIADAAHLCDILAYAVAEPEAIPPAETVEHVEQVEHSKIVLPTDPALIELHNRLTETHGIVPNKRALCREIAAKHRRNAESLRASYNRWRREQGLK